LGAARTLVQERARGGDDGERAQEGQEEGGNGHA